MITKLEQFENNKYNIGDNIIIKVKDNFYNVKIVEIRNFQNIYPYIVITLPYKHISKLPATCDKYNNIFYYIGPINIICKITDNKIVKKMDEEYNKIILQNDAKKYNL